MAQRYCTNCGTELTEDARFCPSCGSPAHETAAISTPEADVPVPPPPQPQAEEGAHTAPHQAGVSTRRRAGLASQLFVGCIVVVFALFALFVGVSIVGGGGGGSDQSGGSKKKQQPTIWCEPRSPCDLGESTVTITRVQATDLISTSLDNYEGHFVLVEFDYTYGGTKPVTVQDYYWKLEDSNGRTYNYAFDPTSSYEIDNNRALIYEEINPGIKNAGAIVFKVAPDAKDFTLHVKDLIRPRTSKQAEVGL